MTSASKVSWAFVAWALASGAAMELGRAQSAPLTIPEGQELRACRQPSGAGRVTAQVLLARGGSPSGGYVWELVPGTAFPEGTVVDPYSGVFMGTGAPLRGGAYPLALTVSDGRAQASATFTLVVEVSPSCSASPPHFMPLERIDLGTAKAGLPFGASLFVRGGEPPYRFGEDVSFAERTDLALVGLAVDESRGVVHGTPVSSAAGRTIRFRVTVVDDTGAAAVSASGAPPVYELRIDPGPVLGAEVGAQRGRWPQPEAPGSA